MIEELASLLLELKEHINKEQKDDDEDGDEDEDEDEEDLEKNVTDLGGPYLVSLLSGALYSAPLIFH